MHLMVHLIQMGKKNIMETRVELKQTVIMEIKCIPAWTGWHLKTGLRR